MTATSSTPPRARWRAAGARLLLLGPGTALLVALCAVPVGLVLTYAFLSRGRFGGVQGPFTWDNLVRIGEGTYADVLVSSFGTAALVTVLALALGYPAAYALARTSARWRTVALVAVLLPFWINFLVRTYAWMLLLNNAGPVASLLTRVGLLDGSLDLLYTRPAVVVGLLYLYLPLMVLPLYATLERLDPALEEAATNLGSRPSRVFGTVTWPLSLPGVLTGAVFVFVPSMSNFVIPEMLGGGKTAMVGTLVRDQFLKARDWPFGAALALVLTAFVLLVLWAQTRVGRGPRDV